MKDLCIGQDGSPENLALVGEILGAAGVNIEGLCLVTLAGKRVIHLAVEDAVTAKRALEDSGIRVSSVSEVLVLDKDKRRVTGKPGSFGGICRTLSDNGIRIEFGYPAENNRFILGLNDVEKARGLLNSEVRPTQTHNQASQPIAGKPGSG